MLLGDILLKMVKLAEDGHNYQDRGDAGEDSPDDEVDTEYGAIPAGTQCHGENVGDHSMNRYGNGYYGNRHDADSLLQPLPLLRCVSPSHGEKSVDSQPQGRRAGPQPVPY